MIKKKVKKKFFLKIKKFNKDKNFFNKNKKKSRLLRKKFNLNLLIPNPILNIYTFKINIKVVSNNIFCTLSKIDSNKILFKVSFGKYKIKISKRSLNLNFHRLLYLFFRDKIFKKHNVLKNNLIVFLTAPIKLRYKILKEVRSKIKKGVILKIFSKKCFNGCKVSKKKKKKRKGFRVFK
jgi:hypothetical protein